MGELTFCFAAGNARVPYPHKHLFLNLRFGGSVLQALQPQSFLSSTTSTIYRWRWCPLTVRSSARTALMSSSKLSWQSGRQCVRRYILGFYPRDETPFCGQNPKTFAESRPADRLCQPYIHHQFALLSSQDSESPHLIRCDGCLGFGIHQLATPC